MPAGGIFMERRRVTAGLLLSLLVASACHDAPAADPRSSFSFPREGRILDVGRHQGTERDTSVLSPTLDELPAASFVAPLIVLDARPGALQFTTRAVSLADFEDWEARHGEIPPGCVVVLRTGPEAASFAPATASFLARERGARALGTERAMLGESEAVTQEIHRVLFEVGAYALVNLGSLDLLPEWGAIVLVAPTAPAGGERSPARVFAVAPRTVAR